MVGQVTTVSETGLLMSIHALKRWVTSCPVAVRDGGAVCIKALYLAIGLNLQDMKEVLGLWRA